MLPPELERLGLELRRTGHTVVPHGDHLCVRLSLFASVRVRLRDGSLHCDPRIGLLGRDASLFLSNGGLVALTTTAFATMGVGPIPFAIGFASVIAAAVDAARVAITEGAITRAQMLFALRQVELRGGIPDAAVPPLSPPGVRPLGPAGGPDVLARERDEVRTPMR